MAYSNAGKSMARARAFQAAEENNAAAQADHEAIAEAEPTEMGNDEELMAEAEAE